MRFFSTVFMALRSLLRNPTRTLLTMLGIIIGIAAVIAMMEIGAGSSASIRSTIEQMGAGSGVVYPGVRRVAGIKVGVNTWTRLLPADAEAIMQECPHISQVSPWKSSLTIVEPTRHTRALTSTSRSVKKRPSSTCQSRMLK